jgi:hypothetical protein
MLQKRILPQPVPDGGRANVLSLSLVVGRSERLAEARLDYRGELGVDGILPLTLLAKSFVVVFAHQDRSSLWLALAEGALQLLTASKGKAGTISAIMPTSSTAVIRSPQLQRFQSARR